MMTFKRACSAFTIALVLVVSSLTPSTAQSIVSPPAVPRLRPAHVLNSHLHGVKPIKCDAAARKGLNVARHWVGHWAYGYWVGLHRGYGAITGNVQHAGRTVSGAEVILASKGKTRRVTFTNVSGGYIMMRVRAGRYRVRAIMGEASGQSPVRLYSGTIVSVPIKV